MKYLRLKIKTNEDDFHMVVVRNLRISVNNQEGFICSSVGFESNTGLENLDLNSFYDFDFWLEICKNIKRKTKLMKRLENEGLATWEKLAHLRKYYRTDDTLYFALKKQNNMLKKEALNAEVMPIGLVQAIDREYNRVTSLRNVK